MWLGGPADSFCSHFCVRDCSDLGGGRIGEGKQDALEVLVGCLFSRRLGLPPCVGLAPMAHTAAMALASALCTGRILYPLPASHPPHPRPCVSAHLSLIPHNHQIPSHHQPSCPPTPPQKNTWWCEVGSFCVNTFVVVVVFVFH